MGDLEQVPASPRISGFLGGRWAEGMIFGVGACVNGKNAMLIVASICS
jgi:hypothetical protein